MVVFDSAKYKIYHSCARKVILLILLLRSEDGAGPGVWIACFYGAYLQIGSRTSNLQKKLYISRMNHIKRKLENELKALLGSFPAVAIVGPRQCGKSTLALSHIEKLKAATRLDLEKPSDAQQLQTPELYLESQSDKLICLDEIQRVPELFPVMRSFIDDQNRNGVFLILGSASPDLLRQSSESLAGRIIYRELSPFLFSELFGNYSYKTLSSYWYRGGFPRSYLAKDDKMSLVWRKNFINTYLERDVPGIKPGMTKLNIQRLLKMLAHMQGQTANYSALGNSLGTSHHTVKNYIDLLAQTYMLRILPPMLANTKKRLVKSPKLYLRDTGILHALLDISGFEDLFSHPVFGASWESLCIENLIQEFEDWEACFYRSSQGHEMDLVLTRGKKRLAFEFKVSKSPKPEKGFWSAITTIRPDATYIMAPVEIMYPTKENVFVAGIQHISKIYDRHN